MKQLPISEESMKYYVLLLEIFRDIGEKNKDMTVFEAVEGIDKMFSGVMDKLIVHDPKLAERLMGQPIEILSAS